MKAAIFQHQRLQAPDKEVRLVKAQDGSSFGICCQLKHFSLNEAPPFVALSYTWGPPTPTHNITINDCTFSVRQNLYDFLTSKARGSVYADQWMWIDQLCIDQTEDVEATAERNFQVQRMHDIYSKALEVSIWLGAGDADSDMAMEVIKTYREREDAGKAVASSPNTEVSNPFSTISDLFEVNQTPGAIWLTFPLRKEESVHRLFNRQYWSRLWVIQEMFLAKRASLMCGSVVLTDEQIPDTMTFWDRFKDRPAAEAIRYRLSSKYRQGLLELWDAMRDDNQDEEELKSSTTLFPLISIIFQYTKAGCYDPRDKIYGLRGLVIPHERVEVDYKKSATQVFTDVVNMLGRSRALVGSEIGDQKMEDLYGLSQQLGLASTERGYERLGLKAKEIWRAVILRKDENDRDVIRNDISYEEMNALSEFLQSLKVSTITFNGFEISFR